MKPFKTVILLSVALSIAACDGTINTPIVIEDGATDVRASQTVNGAIRIGSDVTVVSGNFRSVNGTARVGDRSVVPDITLVNGSITVGEDVQAGELTTVNGSVTVGPRTRLQGVSTVNGSVSLSSGSVVDGDIESVNGRIALDEVRVAGSIRNVNGGMLLINGTLLEGDLIVRSPRGNTTFDERPKVVIGRDVRVLGKMTFEREVQLEIHRSAEVGEIEGAEPVYIDD